jgi:hypothetical protein
VLHLPQLTQLAGRRQLLLETLKAKPCPELPGLLTQLCPCKAVLRSLGGVLEAELIGLSKLPEPLLLRLKLRRLVQLPRLHAEVGTQLLLVEQGLKVSLPRLHPGLLIGQLRLHLSRTISPELLRGLLVCLLKPGRFDVR